MMGWDGIWGWLWSGVWGGYASDDEGAPVATPARVTVARTTRTISITRTTA